MTIGKVDIDQLNNLFGLYKECRIKMESEGVFQWTTTYPSLEIIRNDIHEGYMYGLSENGRIVGAINISDIQEPEYRAIHWQHNEGKVLVIHRLAVHPQFQKMGFAKRLMDFAEDFALTNNYSAIRLDAYSGNERVLRFYENRGYHKRGEVFFPGRKLPFYCYEKQLM